MKGLDFTRRDLLTAVGTTGVVSVSGVAIMTEPAIAYPNSMQMYQGGDFTLEADWRETYNDTPLEDTRANRTSDGAVVSLADVVPGDSGTLSFRLAVVPDSEDDDPSVEPSLSLNLPGTAENDLTDSERERGDASGDGGELQEALDVKLWYDEGLANYDVFGGDNAEQDAGETLVTSGAEGSLADVAAAVTDVPLDAKGCLGTDETLTVSFSWRLDSGVGNEIQSDSVTFDLEITARQC
jgi:hypothetical protein